MITTYRRSCLLIFVGLCSILLCSCIEIGPNIHKYYDHDITLLVASRESIVGVGGYFIDQTIILETDNFGRTLYGFVGGSSICESKVFAVGVVQDSNDSSVFFYDGLNVITQCHNRSDNAGDLKVDEFESLFEDATIEALKVSNEWNQELKPETFFMVELLREKPEPLNENERRRIASEFDPDLHYSSVMYQSTDRNGHLFYILIDDDENVYLLMLSEDGVLIPNTGVLLLTSDQIENIQVAAYQFKITNGWAFH